MFRKPPIVNIPIGFMTDNGPTMNKDFLPEVAKKFPNKSARILVVRILCFVLLLERPTLLV